ncbi:MAG: NAD(P) transhydrogenase subunit alpha [Nitrospirales bacterium]
MRIGIPKETRPGERRVAVTPTVAASLVQAGFPVAVESAAGLDAGYPDAAYLHKGIQVLASRAEVFASADCLLQIHALGANPAFRETDLPLLRAGHVVIGLMEPWTATQAIDEAAQRGVTAFALELIPRTGAAQAMDVLSSMATVAGYKAVLLAADALPKMVPLLMTAAGTITPARVLVIGAGVAGLQAIATAKRLGAVVEAYDVRPSVAEEIASLGAKFLELPLDTSATQDERGYAKALGADLERRQQELLAQAVCRSDVVITTAQVPGRPAPTLITEAMVAGMAPGSVIVDVAAEQGGNCVFTRRGERTVVQDVTILGPVNLPATVPRDASQLYAKNLAAFVRHIVKDGRLRLEAQDPILQDTLVIREGAVVRSPAGDRVDGPRAGAAEGRA